MKKIFAILLIVLIFSSCSKNEEKVSKTTKETPKVVSKVNSYMPANISLRWDNNEFDIKNIMDLTNCNNWNNTLPRMDIHIPDWFKYWLLTIQTKNEAWWTYWNWIAYNIPFWDHPFAKWLDEFPNWTLQAINSSWKKKFSLVCPKKWEKYEYKFFLCWYNNVIPAIDDHTKWDDVINILNRNCLEWTSTTYYWF